VVVGRCRGNETFIIISTSQHANPRTLLCPPLQEHHHICFGCNYHLKMSSQERIDHLIDPGTWRPLDETLSPVDPLEFADMKPYTDRIKEAQAKTGGWLSCLQRSES
jgi:acetyl-CoA carboxylase beta subunit